MTRRSTRNFIAQRASAVLLLPLVVWFLWSLAAHAGAAPAEMRAYLSAPLNAALFAFFVVLAAFHMRIGLAEIIEDYVHSGAKGVLLTVNWLVALGVAAAALYSLYLLAF
ncbi:MAG: succinate dehydrogenase, hydrophobic membrane anchor protein [Amphiplicatus sp.]